VYWIQDSNYSLIRAEAAANFKKPNIAGGKSEYKLKTADV